MPADPSPGTRPAHAALTALLLIALGLASLFLTRPPAPLPATAPADQFSAERAMAHVSVMAERPHPLGSDDHARVRDYVSQTLAGLGLEVDVQKTTGVTPKYRVAGSVENVVGRLRGTGPRDGALLLAAHYDSVAAGPGAGDDASGVAAIFEAVRALRTGPQLQNDLIVLISDGEEYGLLGASAFMAEHPWAKDVRLAINFEARGNAGVSSLFETSAGNGALVREAALAVPGLVGSSLTYEVYKRMPNDTDVTVFKEHGKGALNFAFVGNWEAYHTPSDDPSHLDRGSLQQQGAYALGLARRFGNAKLGSIRSPDAIFFALPGGAFIHYEARTGLFFAAIAVILLTFAALRAVRARRASVLGVLAGFSFSLVSTALLGGVGYAVASLTEWLHAGILPEGNVAVSAAYACALFTLAFALFAGLYTAVRTRLSEEDVAIGAAGVLVLLAIVTSVIVSGVSYLFLWPAAFAALALGLRPTKRGTWSLLLAVPALAIIIPLIQGVYEGLGVSAMGGALIAVLVANLAGALTLPLETVRSGSRRAFVLTPLVLGLALFVAGTLSTRASVAHPKASQLWYVTDADTGTARWASTARRNDAWTAEYVGTSAKRGPLFQGRSHLWLQGAAEPVAGLPVPELVVSEVGEGDDERTLRIEAHAGKDGALDFETSSEVLFASVNGKPVPPSSEGKVWKLTYVNVTQEGVTLTLRVKGKSHVNLSVAQRSRGIPEVAGKPARPQWSVTQHDGDQTLVRREISL